MADQTSSGTSCSAMVRVVDEVAMARDHPAPPAGEHQLRMDFADDGGGLGKAVPPPCTSTATRSRPAGSNGPTSPCLPSTRPPTSVATLAPRSRRLPQTDNGYTGTVRWVQIDLGDDDHRHLIPPEQYLQVAMTRH
jgi:hypothetical protein